MTLYFKNPYYLLFIYIFIYVLIRSLRFKERAILCVIRTDSTCNQESTITAQTVYNPPGSISESFGLFFFCIQNMILIFLKNVITSFFGQVLPI